MTTKHTPTPWAQGTRPYEACLIFARVQGIRKEHLVRIAQTLLWNGSGNESEAIANAEFIVRACNSHDALLAAAKAAEAYLQGKRTGKQYEEADLVDQLRAAIRAAEKGE